MTSHPANIQDLLIASISALSEQGVETNVSMWPFADDPSKSYVLILINFAANAPTLPLMHNINLQIMSQIRQHIDCGDLIGIEVMDMIPNDSTISQIQNVDSGGRICRLSVFTHSIDDFMQMSTDCIVGKPQAFPYDVEPRPGIRCFWYMDPRFFEET